MKKILAKRKQDGLFTKQKYTIIIPNINVSKILFRGKNLNKCLTLSVPLMELGFKDFFHKNARIYTIWKAYTCFEYCINFGFLCYNTKSFFLFVPWRKPPRVKKSKIANGQTDRQTDCNKLLFIDLNTPKKWILEAFGFIFSAHRVYDFILW